MTADAPQFSISELFTPEELDAAIKLHEASKPGHLNKALTAQIVQPALERINALTGQENSPEYLAYMLEYAIMSASSAPKP